MSKTDFEEDFKALVKWNCSALFLMKAVVGIGLKDMVMNFGMVNTFLEDEEHDEYVGDLLFVLLKPDDINILDVLIAEQEADNLNFVGEYDYSGGFVVLVYAIPKEMSEDFIKFKEGKYSKLSTKFKELFDKETIRNYKREKSLQFMVFYKDGELRSNLETFLDVTLDDKAELWQPPSISDGEILKINKYVTTTTMPSKAEGETTNS